ncbi:MAG TPA: hypothetical protein VF693_10015 [Allosphingosinicella sp.]|jgi:hypothetical protein
MTAQAIAWWAAGIAAVLTVLAGLAERARNRRRNLDRVGWMPWQLISVLAFFAAIGLGALALNL